ncbi:hypothetical protein COCVIDRAFT_27349 [Bipolaris victoriae FI3]|uniref:Nephrocystin 3-like N-terminal domain-containing protein n=1 Tax=Bipolaris victoriae (strain FI3) TaxID=930091 RepID=W7EDD3_BIPV3|nr:hypothetical protein COCVIDRAFT_27349 [Bipolaris victoriae FI3]
MWSDPQKVDISGGHVSGNGVQINAHVREGGLQIPSVFTPRDAEEEAALACRDALYLTDPEVDRESVISAKGTRVAGTDRDNDGDGNGDTRLLWISGGLGKGETMISVFLTEQLEEHTARTDNTDLVFFFYSAGDKRRNTAIAVLPPERIQQTLSSLETLWIIFSNTITDIELGTVFCVLDGLDECEDSTLRAFLPKLVGLLAPPTPSSTNASDIELFVFAPVEELSGMKGFNDKFRKSVHDSLLRRTEGWVGFAMHEPSQKQTCIKV